MDIIYTHLHRAAKAWIAAIIPIVAALVVEVLADGTRIDLTGWFAVVGLATAQWFGVYWKSNYEVAVRQADIDEETE